MSIKMRNAMHANFFKSMFGVGVNVFFYLVSFYTFAKQSPRRGQPTEV